MCVFKKNLVVCSICCVRDVSISFIFNIRRANTHARFTSATYVRTNEFQQRGVPRYTSTDANRTLLSHHCSCAVQTFLTTTIDLHTSKHHQHEAHMDVRMYCHHCVCMCVCVLYRVCMCSGGDSAALLSPNSLNSLSTSKYCL